MAPLTKFLSIAIMPLMPVNRFTIRVLLNPAAILVFTLTAWLVACNSPTPVSPTTTPSATSAPPPPTATPLPAVPATSTAIPPLPTAPPTSPFQPDGPEGWCWQEVLGLVNPLNDVFFWDAQTGWVVGERGTILHTDDGGATWQRQVSSVDTDLRRVIFVDAQTGWALGTHLDGETRMMLHTDDGGRTWIKRPVPLQGEFFFSVDMAWANDSTGWLMAHHRVFHTTDGGQTWQEQTLPLENDQLEFITSVDSQHVWVVTRRTTLLRSTDGGANWTAHALEPGYYVEALTFVNAQIGWAVNYNTILHTTDGGQTWQVQHKDPGTAQMRDVVFIDTQTGWVVGFNQVWRTTDGGATWETWEVPQARQAIAFADAQHGWAVGGWRDGKRTTIAHTDDGGVTWQIQDTHIPMPPLAYTSAAHLTSHLAQQEPSLEILLVRLFLGPCNSEDHGWVLSALYNLGWDGAVWGDRLTIPEGFRALRRLDTDLDRDGVDEIVLYSEAGGFIGKFSQLFVGVLDWDGMYWQVAWFNRTHTDYSGSVRVRPDDIDADGQPELLVEMLPFYTGSGLLGRTWNVTIIRCSHLSCRSIWTETLGHIERGGGAGTLYYAWSGSNYRFIDLERDARPEIELQQYGLTFKQTWISSDTPTQDAQVLPITQTVYLWDGAQYTLTTQTELEPGHMLDTRSISKTLDLDGDGQMEQAVYRWVPDCDGLWQTLSLYDHDERGEWQTTQVFTAAVTGMPSAGLSLQDVDNDGRVKVVECTTSFLLTCDLAEIEEWPSMQPDCTVYGWDHVTRSFKPRLDVPTPESLPDRIWKEN